MEKYGIPRAVYMDRKSVFYSDRTPTPDEQLKGEEALSQFGKVCRRLGIELIFANSPQAKGRVERNHGVYQDRLESGGAATWAKACSMFVPLVEEGLHDSEIADQNAITR